MKDIYFIKLLIVEERATLISFVANPTGFKNVRYARPGSNILQRKVSKPSTINHPTSLTRG